MNEHQVFGMIFRHRLASLCIACVHHDTLHIFVHRQQRFWSDTSSTELILMAEKVSYESMSVAISYELNEHNLIHSIPVCVSLA